MKQAIFVSRTGAHLALIKHGKDRLLTEDVIAKHGRAIFATKKGQPLGWVALLPVSNTYPEKLEPILEDAV